MKYKLSTILLFTVSFSLICCQLGLSGCSDAGLKPVVRVGLEEAQHQKQELVSLPVEETPRSGNHIAASDLYIEQLDDDSVEMFLYFGTRYYHPVNLSHRIYSFIGTYRATRNSKYLDRAVKYTAKLVDMLDYYDGAAYVPHEFRYAVHDDSANTFPVPWYSGMAQGEFLGVLVRMYEITGNEDYMALADDVFLSLQNLKPDHKEWVVRLDQSGYYWIEEYPHDVNPGMTLNGFIFALYGVYDYYRVTKNVDALHIWELSLTTLKHYLPSFERRGRASFYCLGHFVSASEGYHNIHIEQMGYLYRMTGDNFFLDIQKLLEEDGQAAFGTNN